VQLDSNGLRWRWRLVRVFSAAVSILVVVHPHFEHVALDADLGAELVERHVIVPLNPPPDPLRELQHLILLLLRELCPEPLRTRPRPHSLRRLRPSIPTNTTIVMMKIGTIGNGGPRIVQQHRRRRQQSRRPHLPSVEVPVASACGARERLERVSSAARHELAAAIAGVAAHGRRVVPHALLVFHNGLDGCLGVHHHRLTVFVEQATGLVLLHDVAVLLLIVGLDYVLVGYHA
jgi:hypothetical protein